LAERYGWDAVNTLLTTTAYKVIFGQNNPQTQKMLSDMIGQTTRRRVSRSRAVGMGALIGRSTRSENLEGVPLIRPEEIGTLKFGRQLVIAQNHTNRPVRCRSPFYWKTRPFKRRWRLR
jgi:type IV secretion system protein VirD4